MRTILPEIAVWLACVVGWAFIFSIAIGIPGYLLLAGHERRPDPWITSGFGDMTTDGGR